METKLKALATIQTDVKYLQEEYNTFKLWGSCPDGDVGFHTLLKWLTDHKYEVGHMIKIGEMINEFGEK